MFEYLPYGHQWIDDRDIEQVIKVLESSWITQGPKVDEFERTLAEFVGARYVVVFNSGTASLHAACFAAGVKKGDEAITTPISFVATGNCVLYLGAKPVFADIKEDTYNINPEEIKKKVTSRTKVILPVDFAGHPVDLKEIHRIAKENNLLIIEDACHALGAEYKNEKIGSCRYSDMTVFSFHTMKQITTGEGGAVTTNNKDFYDRLILFRNHGITKNPARFIDKDEGPWYYEMQNLGFNYRITDFQCALGISQLKKLDKFIERRKEIVQMYNEAFEKMEEIIIPQEKPDVKSAWHLYVIRLKLDEIGKSRREIFEALRKENIGVQVHYIPVYYHPYYQKLGYQKGICPVAEKYYEEAITLPLFPKMKNSDVIRVINKVKKQVAYSRKKVFIQV